MCKLTEMMKCQYLMTTVESGLVDVLSFGLLGSERGDPTRELRVAIKKVCEELLPEAIGLSDGFGFTDWELDRWARSCQCQ